MIYVLAVWLWVFVTMSLLTVITLRIGEWGERRYREGYERGKSIGKSPTSS